MTIQQREHSGATSADSVEEPSSRNGHLGRLQCGEDPFSRSRSLGADCFFSRGIVVPSDGGTMSVQG
jgi:hypothetical protein